MTDGDNENGRGDQAPATRDTNTVNELREIAAKLDGGRIFSGKMHAQAHSGGTCILRISKAVARIKQLSEAQNRAITTTIKQLQEDRDKVIAAQNRPTKEAQERLNGEWGQAIAAQLRQINEARDRFFAEIQAGLEQLKKEKARRETAREYGGHRHPKGFALCTTKPENELFAPHGPGDRDIFDPRGLEFNVGRNVVVSAIFATEDINLPKGLTELDRIVHDAIGLLCLQNRSGTPTKFTINELARQIFHTDKKPTEKQKTEIKESISKLNRTLCTLHVRDHLALHGIESSDEQFRGVRLLNTCIHIKDISGNLFEEYIVNGIMPLVEYAYCVGQIKYIDKRYMDIKKIVDEKPTGPSITDTETRLLIRVCLLRDIARVASGNEKAQKKFNKAIEINLKDPRYIVYPLEEYQRQKPMTLETLLHAIGLNTASTAIKKRILDYIEIVLQNWQSGVWEREGKAFKQILSPLIAGFEIVTPRKSTGKSGPVIKYTF